MKPKHLLLVPALLALGYGLVYVITGVDPLFSVQGDRWGVLLGLALVCSFIYLMREMMHYGDKE